MLVEPRPRNWGDDLTLVGAMRVDRWLTLSTAWGAMTTPRFIEWVQRRLVPRLRHGDIGVLDNGGIPVLDGQERVVRAGVPLSARAALCQELQQSRSWCSCQLSTSNGRRVAEYPINGPGHHRPGHLRRDRSTCRARACSS